MSQSFPYELQIQLIETLCAVFYYKDPLQGFLMNFNIPAHLLEEAMTIIYQQTKKPGLRFLFSELKRLPEHQGDEILYEMANQLSNWDVFEENDDYSRESVKRLAQILAKYQGNSQQESKKKSEEIDREAKRHELHTWYETLFKDSTNPQQRGLVFEREFLQALLEFENLEPSGSITLKGEQIDNFFRFEGKDFLLEAKWTQDATEGKDVSDFQAKVEGKLSLALGLIISVNGFTPNAVERAGLSKRIILMDGHDLYMALDDRFDLSFCDILEQKRKAFAQTGDPFFKEYTV